MFVALVECHTQRGLLLLDCMTSQIWQVLTIYELTGWAYKVLCAIVICQNLTSKAKLVYPLVMYTGILLRTLWYFPLPMTTCFISFVNRKMYNVYNVYIYI